MNDFFKNTYWYFCLFWFSPIEEREINNGRFAMFAAIGIIAAELYSGKDAIEQFGL